MIQFSAEEFWNTMDIGSVPAIAQIEARDAEWRRLVEEARAERDTAKLAVTQRGDALMAAEAERVRDQGQCNRFVPVVEDPVAALAKLVTQLQDGCTESGARRATETVALAKRVGALEEWARRQVAEPWFDPERKPEVAGLGHAFVPDRDHRCAFVMPDGDRCGWVRSDHAVPSIAPVKR